MANWRIDYDLLDRTINKATSFSRNARFVSAKWRRENTVAREVVVIPIQRTVPANELAKFRHFIGLIQQLNVNKVPLDKKIVEYVSRILGKDASQYMRVSLKSDENRSILVGMKNSNDYSQFHFGAGEASIIDMVSRIEEADDYSLILIEEIENGLHPLATRKMVEYLFDVAKRKKAQILFTTHSEYALDVLPAKAIWACIDGSAYQGKLTIESLRALTGSVTKDHAVFVEDEFAKDLSEEIIRQYGLDIFEKVQVHKAGGYPYVVEVLKHHNANPTIKNKAVALIDGDNPPLSEANEFVIELPDGTPEAIVFGYIKDNASNICALIQQRCQCPSIPQDNIVKYIDQVMIDTTDHHLYFSKLGEKLGYVSELVIRRGLCSIYVERNAGQLSVIVDKIKSLLFAN